MPKKKTNVADQWLEARRAGIAAALIVLSIIIRAVYFSQMNATPLIELDRWSQSDMHYYNDWARQIAAGDWLSRRVGPPMHLWQRDVADYYLDAHPYERADLTRRTGADGDVDTALWSQWMRTPQFYQDPLYQYMAGATYKIFGANVRWVFLWQLALGVGTNVLIWLLTRRFFGDLAAAIAAALALLCAPLMYYELLLLRESAVVFASVALVWLMDRAVDRKRAWRFGVLGVALGLAALLKSTLLLFTVGAAIATIAALRSNREQLVRCGSALAAGIVIAFAPYIARNVAVGAPAFSSPGLGVFTFVSANESDYSPSDGFAINTRTLAKFLGDTDRTWSAALRTTVFSQSVDNVAALMWQKWERAWHWYEMPNNDNIYYAQRSVAILRWLPITFGLCAPLALVGVIIGIRRWRDNWLLYQLLLISLVPLLMFYVLGRFRVPLLAALLPFAALAIRECVLALWQRSYSRALIITSAVVVASLWTMRPLDPSERLIRTDDWLLPFLARDQIVVEHAVEHRDWSGAAAAYERFFKDEPTNAEIIASDDPDLPARLQELHTICARLWRQASQDQRADAQLARATQLRQLTVTKRALPHVDP